MTTKTIEAVYEHGNFRPVSTDALAFEEGEKVRLSIEPIEEQIEMPEHQPFKVRHFHLGQEVHVARDELYRERM